MAFLQSQNPKVSDINQIKILRKFLYEDCQTVAEVQAACIKRNKQLEEYRQQETKQKYLRKKYHLQELIKSAKIPKIFSSNRAKDFKLTENNSEAAKQAIQAITNNKGLYIYGECGTGKTMLASIIANERAELLKPSAFIGAVDIFQELNPFANDSQTAATRKHIIKTTECLIIDDLGAEKPSDWTKQTLFEIVDFRYRENLQTIITSNFSVERLMSEGRLKDYEGKRIIRRIKAICNLIELAHY